MPLDVYRSKRDFRTTTEPKGGRTAAQGRAFVIQKHAARRLHYDLRLELDGVLKSWAVTRGPSEVPGDKRLAVHVEDHPLEYADFEGTIPKGEYGGGSVIVWDRGTWAPLADPRKGLAKGHLEFELDGEKLRGRWHLVRMERKPREKNENWLLIKANDDAAPPAAGADILSQRPDSVKTGRQIEDLAAEPPGWSSKTGRIEQPAPAARKTQAPQRSSPAIKGAKKAPLPEFVPPELATLAARPPKGERWVHEIKFDGYRLQARISPQATKLLTRTGLDWTERFGGPILAAFAALPVRTALIDGELVVETAAGASDFSALQADLSDGRTDRYVYYAFDLLHLDGYDLRAAPLAARKDLLEQILKDKTAPGLLRFSAHFAEDGALILRQACRLSLEGIISKLKDGPYRSGRSRDWLKAKCSQQQEFVIGGYVDSAAAAKAIGSLVLGYYEDGKLIHAGRVGTGFSAAVARDLYARLEPLRQKARPFADPLEPPAARGVRYVRPELVAEIAFRGFTADHNLRHASFQGLREDKPAGEVVDETGADPPPRPSVKLTHPDRVYWPDAGVTKEGLVKYYADVWPRMAPFVVGRPLSLLRCPDGVGGQCFFQKHIWRGAGKSIRRESDPADPSGEPILGIEDFDGLVSLAQAGVLEIHPWGSTWAALEQPDMIIIDLDPGEGTGWEAVIAAAKETRERLTKTGLQSFVKTSGGKGLHVCVPLLPKAGWPAVKAFAKSLAEAMARDAPALYVANIAKAKRQGKILIDYLRNGRGATAVAPYSTRARAGAPVSMPLAWEELGPAIGPARFTVANAAVRLARRDPWADFRRAAAALPASKAKS